MVLVFIKAAAFRLNVQFENTRSDVFCLDWPRLSVIVNQGRGEARIYYSDGAVQ